MEELNGEVKHLKERLLAFEQLAIMGKLLLCAVYELNCLLGEIESSLSVVQDKGNDPAIRERNLSKALAGLDKMSKTIRSLLPNTNPF
jgi:hypothetical protein